MGLLDVKYIGKGSFKSAQKWTSFYLELDGTFPVLMLFECNIDTYKFFIGTEVGKKLLDKYGRIYIMLTSNYEASTSGLLAFLYYLNTRHDCFYSVAIVSSIAYELSDIFLRYDPFYQGSIGSSRNVKHYLADANHLGDDNEFVINTDARVVVPNLVKPLNPILQAEYYAEPTTTRITPVSHYPNYPDGVNRFIGYIIERAVGEKKESIYYSGVYGAIDDDSEFKWYLDTNFTKMILAISGYSLEDQRKLMARILALREIDTLALQNLTLVGFDTELDETRYKNDIATAIKETRDPIR